LKDFFNIRKDFKEDRGTLVTKRDFWRTKDFVKGVSCKGCLTTKLFFVPGNYLKDSLDGTFLDKLFSSWIRVIALKVQKKFKSQKSPHLRSLRDT
jgi:hypothetical protein